MEPRCKNNWQEKQKNWERNLSQCRLAHHKYHKEKLALNLGFCGESLMLGAVLTTILINLVLREKFGYDYTKESTGYDTNLH